MQRQRHGAMSFICLAQWKIILCRNFQRRHQTLFISVCQTTRPEPPSQKHELQEWVDYANKNGAVIIYDAAYEAYISEDRCSAHDL